MNFTAFGGPVSCWLSPSPQKCTDMPSPLPCIANMHCYLQPTRMPRIIPQKDNKSGAQIFSRRIDFSSLCYQVLLLTCLCIKARRTELHSWLFDKESSFCFLLRMRFGSLDKYTVFVLRVGLWCDRAGWNSVWDKKMLCSIPLKLILSALYYSLCPRCIPSSHT